MKLPEQAFPSTHDGVARVHNIFPALFLGQKYSKREEWDSRKSLVFFCFVLN